MKLIRDIYKTKSLAEYGRFICYCLLVLLPIGSFIIPNYSPKSSTQLLAINGNHLKYDDKEIVSDYFNSIKSNNGYLCLGTSESTSIKHGGNYYNFLNDDPDLEIKFSVLAGAGRTCGKYVPIFLNHKEDVKDLNLIYYINPVYWREDLCSMNKAYWNRYANYGMINNISISEDERNLYLKGATEYINDLYFIDKFTATVDYSFRGVRTNYFQDLWYHMNPNSYENNNTYIREKKNDLSIYKSFGKIDNELIDTISNEKKEHSTPHSFEPTNNDVKYRYEELISFIKLCENLEVNITYILGPYNERFIKHHAPDKLEGYQITVENIQQILDQHKVKYINATDATPKAGTFSDPMHNSSFGAYLIYLKIKNHVNEQ